MSYLGSSSLIVEYDMSDIKRNSKLFFNKFHVLTIMRDEEKLIIGNENILQIDTTYKPIQFAMRWFYSQGREVLQPYLVEQFNDYINFLDLLKLAKNSNRLNDLEKEELYKLADEHNQFILQLSHGFNILTDMYNDFELMVHSIKNINSSLKLRLIN